MAQNIEISNAQYNDVPSIEVPKQGGGTAEFVDTSDADAIASEIDMGKTAYVNGVKLTGTRSGGGSSYSETVLFSNASGVNSGTIALSGNVSDYDLIAFTLGQPTKSWNNIIYQSSFIHSLINDSAGFVLVRYVTSRVTIIVTNDNSFNVSFADDSKIYKIIGIKFG